MVLALYGRVLAWVHLADVLGVSRWWSLHFAAQALCEVLPAVVCNAYAEAVNPWFAEAVLEAQHTARR